MEFQPPVPFQFNPWKHHRQWVCQQIEVLKELNGAEIQESILRYIASINSNHVDIYKGNFSPDEIQLSDGDFKNHC